MCAAKFFFGLLGYMGTSDSGLRFRVGIVGIWHIFRSEALNDDLLATDSPPII